MKNSNTKNNNPTESDSSYFLKLVLFVILGTLWIKFQEPLMITDDFALRGVPLGLFVGMIFASHDHFQIDRKIEYAILLIMTIASLYLPVGIVL